MPGKKGKISAKAKAAGSKVIAAAKRYKKEHPSAKWQTAMKMGGAAYRRTHK